MFPECGRGRYVASRMHFEPVLKQALELHRHKQFEQAQRICRRLIKADPTRADVKYLLGMMLSEVGKYELGAEYIRQAIYIAPAEAQCHYNLGNTLLKGGRPQEACDAYRRAIQIKPTYVEAIDSLGAALLAMGKVDQAMAQHERAIELNPKYALAYVNLGAAQVLQKKNGLAYESYRRAIEISPFDIHALKGAAYAALQIGRTSEAVDYYRRAHYIEPTDASVHHAMLLAMHYDPQFTSKEIFFEHRYFDEVHARKWTRPNPPLSNSRDPDRPLRIGYVSADFREHAVASFIEPILAWHDPTEFEVYAYANVPAPDAFTENLRTHVKVWREIKGLPNRMIAKQIRKDRIDILVDLSGHTLGNRLGVFARRVAPVQVTYLGYPNTTGLDAMHWRIVDSITDPPRATELYHTEDLCRVDPCFLCYRPPDIAPEVGTPPVEKNAAVTFVSFNHIAKVSHEIAAAWGEILRQVPGSTLLVKLSTTTGSLGLDYGRQRLIADGIPSDRLRLLPAEPTVEAHLVDYQRGDIALDTFPYNGTTTTCEALWMGLPVITLSGQTHVSRVSRSVLSAVGLPELATDSIEQYVQAAVALARDTERLARLRGSLRRQMHESVLCDAGAFISRLQNAYRAMWREWCAA